MATIVPRALEGNCITGDTAIKGSPGVVYAVALAATGAENCTLILYDNASAAAGEREIVLAAATRGSASYTPVGVGHKFNNGIYADISGAGAYATVLYE